MTVRLMQQMELLRLREFAAAALDDSLRRPAQTLALLDLLIKHHPTLDSEALAKGRVAALLFPDKSGNTARAEVERLMSQLLLLIQRFLCVNEFAFSLLPDKMTNLAAQLISQLRQHLAMMRFYNRNLNLQFTNADAGKGGGSARLPDNLALNHYNRAQRVLERSAVRFADFTEQQYGDFYYILFQLEYEKHFLLNLRHDQRTGFMGLPEVIEKLDASYYSAKLDLIGRLLHLQRMMQEKNADEEMQQWLDANIEITRSSLGALRAHKQKYPAAVALYSALVELLGATEVGQTDEAATRLWQLVQANPDSLPKPRMEAFFYPFERILVPALPPDPIRALSRQRLRKLSGPTGGQSRSGRRFSEYHHSGHGVHGHQVGALRLGRSFFEKTQALASHRRSAPSTHARNRMGKATGFSEQNKRSRR